MRFNVTGILIGFSATLAAAPTIALNSAATTTLFTFTLPIDAAANPSVKPVYLAFNRPLVCNVGESAILTCTGIGGAGTSQLNIFGFFTFD